MAGETAQDVSRGRTPSRVRGLKFDALHLRGIDRVPISCRYAD